jgi:hypothetical protein
MTEKPPKSTRGGPREGSGRPMNLRKRCEILAIASSLVISEGSARRIWTDYGGDMPRICKKSAALFWIWDQMTEAAREALFEVLREEVDRNRAEGLTTK